jgi:hypothetical protein
VKSWGEALAEHERFLSIAGGDPALAKVVYDNLRRLEEGAGGPAMQELARDVLAGKIGLREAANSGAYAEAFRDLPYEEPVPGGWRSATGDDLTEDDHADTGQQEP